MIDNKKKGFLMAIFIALLMTTVTMIVALCERKRQSRKTQVYDHYSSLSPSPNGIKALYLLLLESGYRTRRVLQKLDKELLDSEPITILFMIAPIKPLTPSEANTLQTWIENGGTLITQELETAHLRTSQFPTSGSNIFETPVAPAGCRIEGTHWVECKTESEISEIILPVNSVTTGFMFESQKKIKLTNKKFFCKYAESAGEKNRAIAQIALYNKCRAFISIRNYRSGRIIFLHFPSILTNSNITGGGNIKLLFNLLKKFEKWSNKTPLIAFDEYHIGFGEKKPSIWNVLGRGALIGFYQFLLAVLVAIIAVSRRFSPPHQTASEPIRQSINQIETHVNVFEKARCYRLALKIIHRSTKNRWGQSKKPLTEEEKALYKALCKIYNEAMNLDTNGKEKIDREQLKKYSSLLQSHYRRVKNG